MITNVSLVSLWVKDISEALAFYTEILGFEAKDDLMLGEDFAGARSCIRNSPSCRST